MENNNTIDIVRQKLYNLSEDKYKKFTSSLLPGVKNILGVRLPQLRKISKEISKEDYKDYLNNKNHIYFEEHMICGMVIGYIKTDCDTKLKFIKEFVPKIDNWSVCDSFCNGLKFTKENKQKVFEFLQPYFQSQKCFYVRFAVVMLLNYYINEEYLDKVFNIFDNIDNSEYYAEVAVSWAISMCYVKYPSETMEYLKKSKVSNFVYNKSIQKICESRRVSNEQKNMIKKLKK